MWLSGGGRRFVHSGVRQMPSSPSCGKKEKKNGINWNRGAACVRACAHTRRCAERVAGGGGAEKAGCL